MRLVPSDHFVRSSDFAVCWDFDSGICRLAASFASFGSSETKDVSASGTRWQIGALCDLIRESCRTKWCVIFLKACVASFRGYSFMEAARYTASPCSHKPSKPTAKNGRAVFVWLPICGTLSEWVAGARVFRMMSITLFMIQCFICNMEVDIPLTWVYWWNIMQVFEVYSVSVLRMCFIRFCWLVLHCVHSFRHGGLVAMPPLEAALTSCCSREKGHWGNNEITEWNNKWT